MQNGSIMRGERRRGPDVWEYRWREPGADGKRKHRRMVVGSVHQLRDKTAVIRATSALRRDINMASRQLERQIRAALFERTVLASPKVSAVMRQTHPEALSIFRDSYALEFLELCQTHTEEDLHRGLLRSLREFLIELGRDFCFIGSEVPLRWEIGISRWTCSSSIAGCTRRRKNRPRCAV